MQELVEPKFGPIGQEVYERTYRRSLPNGEPEKWGDTVRRVVNGNTSLVSDKFIEPGERDKLYDLIYNFRAIPAGRHLWVSGVPGRQFLFNCHRAAFSDIVSEHYGFAFNMLMQGGGVGSNYSNRYIDELPDIQNHLDIHIVCDPNHPDYEELKPLLSKEYSSKWDGCFRIEDSREGWVDALCYEINGAYGQRYGEWLKNNYGVIVYDVSIIRERGKKIRGFGGVASGPYALAEMLIAVNNILNSRIGKKLPSLGHMLIDHEVAKAVVAGNVRRSARMSIKSWKDDDIIDFIHCKEDWQYHWTTNISVEIDDDFFKALKSKDDHAKAVYRAVINGMVSNGEPGFYNVSLAQEGEIGDVGSTNPCGEIALEPWENCFSGSERVLTKEYGAVSFLDIVGETVTVMTPEGWAKGDANYFGQQSVNKYTFIPVTNTANGVYQRSRSNYTVDVVATPNHRWELIDGQITSNLSVGDIVPMNAAETSMDENGIRHGIIFGDGSVDRQYMNGDYRCRVKFYGQNAEEMSSYFEHITYGADAPEGWLRSSNNLKNFPLGNEGSNYLAGFLYGWMLADGTKRPNGSIHLGSTHPYASEWLRNHAASAGWILRADRDSGTTETNLGVRKNLLRFFTLVKPSTIGAWRVSYIDELPEKEAVYCITVPNVERFTLASGISTMNCNLGHVNLGEFVDDFEGSKEAFRLMTRFLMRATFGDISDPKQAEVVARNRRIGVGFFGFQSWLVQNDIKFSDSHRNRYVRKTLRDWKSVVDKEKRRYAFQLRIPEPIKGTTIAPTGSIAKLCGETEGIHTVFAPYVIRNIRYSSNDPKVQEFIDQGYEIEDCLYTPNTKVVRFYMRDPLLDKVDDESLVEGATDVGLADMLAVQAMVQECYADNAVSFTVNFEPDSLTVEEAEKIFIHYLPYLKGTTLFPSLSRPQSPFQKISKEDYELYNYIKISGSGELACGVNACPVK